MIRSSCSSRVAVLSALTGFLLLLVAAGAGARPRLISSFTQLGIDGRLLGFDGRMAVFRAEESELTGDLNGDGDTRDAVVQVHDASDDSLTTLDLELYSETDIRFVGDDLVLRTQSGRRLHHFDPDSKVFTDLDRNAREWETFGSLLFLWTRESVDGEDLNGDGDLQDFVLGVFDPAETSYRNLGLAVNLLDAAGDDGVVAFSVDESAQGQDLDGDGDLLDEIVHVYDVATGDVTSLDVEAERVLVEDELVILRLEEQVVGLDLNGDGDELDRVLLVHDPGTGAFFNTGVAERVGHETLVGDGILYALYSEPQNGFDRNGDGDLQDNVIQVIDPRAESVVNTGFAFADRRYFVTPDGLYGSVSESAQAGLDLNGDGNLDDELLCEVDRDTGQAFVFDIGAEILAGGERALAFLVPEYREPGLILNGDGDSHDKVLHVLDLETGAIRNCGLAIQYPETLRVSGHLVAASVSEIQQGIDFNGDGDLTDQDPHFYDLDVDRVTRIETVHRFGFNTEQAFDISGDYIRVPRSNAVVHDTISNVNTDDLRGINTILIEGDRFAMTLSIPEVDNRVFGVGILRAPWEGTVNTGVGAPALVLQVNGEEQRAVIPANEPIDVTLDAAPAGVGAYVLYAWNSLPTGSFPIQAGNELLGCTVLPTSLQAGESPQPRTCVVSSLLGRNPCPSADSRIGPATTPLSFLRPKGFPVPATFTVQAVMEDAGASNDLGWSVSNAVTFRVVE